MNAHNKHKKSRQVCKMNDLDLPNSYVRVTFLGKGVLRFHSRSEYPAESFISLRQRMAHCATNAPRSVLNRELARQPTNLQSVRDDRFEKFCYIIRVFFFFFPDTVPFPPWPPQPGPRNLSPLTLVQNCRVVSLYKMGISHPARNRKKKKIKKK